MDIEDALIWAYRDEMPKRTAGGSDGASSIAMMMELGTAIDSWSLEPGFPLACGEPDPDAVLIDEAVKRLASFADQPIDGDLDLAPEVVALGADEQAAMRRALLMVAGTVVRCAKLGIRPFWPSENPKPKALIGGNGKPMVARWATITQEALRGPVYYEDLVAAEAFRKDVYHSGAFCPLEFTPDPQSFVEERADYAAWWSALDRLAHELRGTLKCITTNAPAAPERPWIDPGEAERPVPRSEAKPGDADREQARKTAEAYRRLGMRRQRESWRRCAQPAIREKSGPRHYSVALVRERA